MIANEPQEGQERKNVTLILDVSSRAGTSSHCKFRYLFLEEVKEVLIFHVQAEVLDSLDRLFEAQARSRRLFRASQTGCSD